MGLTESHRGNRTYVSIVNGGFAQRVTEDTPKAVKRIIEDKKTKVKREVWELLYGTAEGVIQSIEVDESGSFGDQLKINMADGDLNFTVSLSMAGREAKSFLCVLKNVDLNTPVVLLPYNFTSKDDNTQRIGLNVYQGASSYAIQAMKPDEKKNLKVKPHFSKETPNGLPQVPKKADKDEFKITMKQQEIYLKKWVKKFIGDYFADAPKVGNRESSIPPTDHQAIADKAIAPKKNEKIYTNASTPSDDLPF
jgi:hypothetical protein